MTQYPAELLQKADFSNPLLLHFFAELGGGPTGDETQDDYYKEIARVYGNYLKIKSFKDLKSSGFTSFKQSKSKMPTIKPNHINDFLDAYKSGGAGLTNGKKAASKKQREKMVAEFRFGRTGPLSEFFKESADTPREY